MTVRAPLWQAHGGSGVQVEKTCATASRGYSASTSVGRAALMQKMTGRLVAVQVAGTDSDRIEHIMRVHTIQISTVATNYKWV